MERKTKILVFILLLLCYQMVSYSQVTWNTIRIKNTYDEMIDRAYVHGEYTDGYKGTKPLLIVDKYVKYDYYNIYLTNVGYFLCDNPSILISFDHSNQFYKIKPITNENCDLWLFNLETKESEILIKKLRLCYEVIIIVKSDCLNNSYTFSLKNSDKTLKRIMN